MRALVRGGLLAVCAAYACAVGATSADDAVDRSFGSAGTVALPGRDVIPMVAVLPDDRVRVAYYDVDSNSLQLRGLLVDGTPDPAFGSGGAAHADLGLAADDSLAMGDFRIDADGALTLVLVTGAYPKYTRIGLLRYTASGAPDATFGGVRWLPISGCASEFGWDGAHWMRAGTGYVVAVEFYCNPDGVVDLWKLHADGTPDTSFGSGGTRQLSFGMDFLIGTMPLANGGIQMLRTYHNSETRWHRLRADGLDDTVFGPGGIQAPVYEGVVQQAARTLSLQADGRALVQFDRVVRAVKPNGDWDRSFAGGGMSLPSTPMYFTQAQIVANAGRVAFVGTSETGFGTPWDGFYIYLRDTAGNPVTAFAENGTLFDQGPWFANAALDSRGRIVVAMMWWYDAQGAAIVRYTPRAIAGTLAPVPVLSPWLLAFGGMLLAGVGGRAVRRSRGRRSSATCLPNSDAQ